MTGNKIGYEGTKTMSEALKVNTTLTYLDLDGEEERKKGEKRKKEKKNE